MAKKPKKDADAEGAGNAGGATGGGRKKLIILGLAGALLLAGGGGGAYFFLFRTKEPATEKAEDVKKAVAFVELRELIINLASEPNQDRSRFLKFKVALEVADPKIVPEIQPLLPRVEDVFQVYVRELRPSDLEGSGSVYRLREELLRRVNMAVYPAKVNAVLFKDMMIQ